MRNDSTQICRDCKSTKLIWDWANGDLVCTACGLVAQERFIDERVSYNDRNYYCSDKIQTPTVSRELQRTIQHTNVINATLLNSALDNTTDMAEAINDFCNQTPRLEVNVSKKATTTAGIYANTQGVTVKDLCYQMNIKTSDFWKATTRHGLTTMNPQRRFQDLLKRTIYTCEYIPKAKEWQTFKIARQLLEAIHDSPHFQNIKPERIVISLMIIACGLSKATTMTRADLCKQYKLSQETLTKHEALLQQLLSGAVPGGVPPP
jgi:hypothetical protein